MASLGNDVVMLDPSVIYFTFSRIRPVFSCGRTIDSTYEQFISGELSPTDLPLLCVFTDGEGRYYSQNNRRLFLYKKLQSEGKLSVVPVRLRPLPSTKRMGHKYSPSKCSLTAKLMGRAGGAPPSGSSALSPAVDAEPTSTKSKSRSSSSSSLHEHPRAAAAPHDSSVSKAEVTTSSSKPQMEKSATQNTRMKKQQKKKGYKNTVREDSDEDNVNSNLADVLASLNKKHWLQGSEEEEEEEKEEKLTFLTKKSSRQNKKKNKGRSEEQ